MHIPGHDRIRDHRYWLPLIMLFSGARPAEIAQLLTDDVRKVHGHWVMHITSEGSKEKSVKTRGSMRVVPLHSELGRLGFTEYCEEMRRRGEQRCFPRPSATPAVCGCQIQPGLWALSKAHRS